MAAAATATNGGTSQSLRRLITDIVQISGFRDSFKKDCTDLGRRISLLSHLADEIEIDDIHCKPLEEPSCLIDLILALEGTKRVLLDAASFDLHQDGACNRFAFEFQCVTWKLEKALGNIPYDDFGVSEEVQERLGLVRTQLKRAIERYGPVNCSKLTLAASQPLTNEPDLVESCNEPIGSLCNGNRWNILHDVKLDRKDTPCVNSLSSHCIDVEQKMETQSTSSMLSATGNGDGDGTFSSYANKQDNSSHQNHEESWKPESTAIPEDFLCPISLEMMRDPVIVATGQTYERLYIQRWIGSGNVTCPKTQQKLRNVTLTPNYALRSLIFQWCTKHDVEQPTALVTGKIKKSDGSFRDVSADIAVIQALVCKLSSKVVEDHRAAVAEIRSLSKRSTDNRILVAEAGAIPALIKLLTSDDVLTQDNAITSILNLSIYESNKELIMLAGAIPSIVQVLRNGSMEARENAAATLFSLSLANENKIIIGASGAIPALGELLQNGSSRGKKDAATALFNLCTYQGNKGRAVRVGIITTLMLMLTESNGSMVDEALTILSLLAGHQEAKAAIVKACTIPVLIDLMRSGLARNKENAAAILLALCKRDTENVACLSRLGAAIPLTEITRSGTERAKRKATSLLELLRKLQHQH